jgi:hypothetical protein
VGSLCLLDICRFITIHFPCNCNKVYNIYYQLAAQICAVISYYCDIFRPQLPEVGKKLRPKHVGAVINNNKNAVQQVVNKYGTFHKVERKMYNIISSVHTDSFHCNSVLLCQWRQTAMHITLILVINSNLILSKYVLYSVKITFRSKYINYKSKSKRFFPSQKHPDQLWSRTSSLFEYRDRLLQIKWPGLTFTTHLRVSPKLKISGALLLISKCICYRMRRDVSHVQ